MLPRRNGAAVERMCCVEAAAARGPRDAEAVGRGVHARYACTDRGDAPIAYLHSGLGRASVSVNAGRYPTGPALQAAYARERKDDAEYDLNGAGVVHEVEPRRRAQPNAKPANKYERESVHSEHGACASPNLSTQYAAGAARECAPRARGGRRRPQTARWRGAVGADVTHLHAIVVPESVESFTQRVLLGCCEERGAQGSLRLGFAQLLLLGGRHGCRPAAAPWQCRLGAARCDNRATGKDGARAVRSRSTATRARAVQSGRSQCERALHNNALQPRHAYRGHDRHLRSCYRGPPTSSPHSRRIKAHFLDLDDLRPPRDECSRTSIASASAKCVAPRGGGASDGSMACVSSRCMPRS